MNRTPACSSERIVETYRDHTSSCARMHKFGAIKSLADDAHAAGMTGFRKGVLIVLGFASLIYCAAVML